MIFLPLCRFACSASVAALSPNAGSVAQVAVGAVDLHPVEPGRAPRTSAISSTVSARGVRNFPLPR
jgi:hypothetical protein